MEHSLLSMQTVQAETVEKGRIYNTPEGNFWSVTTMLSATKNNKGLQEWKERVGEDEAKKICQKATQFGTQFHECCEQYLMNKGQSTVHSSNPIVLQAFNIAKPLLKKSISVVYGIELPLYSKRLQLAGRTDAIVEWEGKLSILDYKFISNVYDINTYVDYFLQCTAYAYMVQEMYNICPKNIVLFLMPRIGNSPIVLNQGCDKYLIQLNQRIKSFRQIEKYKLL